LEKSQRLYTTKLNSACFASRTVKFLLSKDALKMLYFSYIHSIISYGVTFCSNSTYSIKMFRIQFKKIIRINTNLRNRDSCTTTFKTMKILPSYSQYIFSWLINIMNNKHLFIPNQEIHNINTTSNPKFHIPRTNLAKFQKWMHYSGIKLFYHLPSVYLRI